MASAQVSLRPIGLLGDGDFVYVTVRRRWYRCAGPVAAAIGSTPDNPRWTLPVQGADGRYHTIPLCGETIRVTLGGQRPPSFSPDTLRRQARAEREHAAALLATAQAREDLAAQAFTADARFTDEEMNDVSEDNQRTAEETQRELAKALREARRRNEGR